MDAFLTPAESEALLLSLRISFVAVFGALPFAFAGALLLARTRFPGKTLVDGLIHVPLVLPPVAIGFLLLMALGTRGRWARWLLHNLGIRFVFSWTGAALASAIITFPFQVRAIRLSLEAIDPGLAQAAQTLGAGWFDRLINLTLAAGLARHRRRRDHRLRRQPGRVRRHHHLRLQHPGRDAHAAARRSTPRCRRRAAKPKPCACPCSRSCWP